MILFFDKLIAFFALILLSPVLLIVAIFIIIDSKGPIFFRQVRVGRDLKIFRIYKFRSMTHSPSRFTGEVSENLSTEEKQKLRENFQTTGTNDNRITKIGKFIRKTSLDELPQILNVLSGDMSIVGPRPDTPVQEVDYKPEQWKQRHEVRPGITGLAQVSGRSNITFEDRINADLEYVKNKSFLLYLRIIFLTFYQVISNKGTN
ncbi:sugar transferase [Pedobacter caeni]|nr:sugar transferase [Pedobacter caeni]